MLLQNAATTTTNAGTFKVDANATLSLANAGGLFVNDGSLSNAGSVTLSGDASWTQNAHNTAQSGNPVTILNSGTLTDMTGAGSFTLTDTPILTGTIPAGQTVAVSAPSGHGATVSLNGGTVINDGNLNMDAPAGGETPIIDDGSITNNGAITTTSESSNPNQLQANLTNNATVEVKTGTLQQSAATDHERERAARSPSTPARASPTRNASAKVTTTPPPPPESSTTARPRCPPTRPGPRTAPSPATRSRSSTAAPSPTRAAPDPSPSPTAPSSPAPSPPDRPSPSAHRKGTAPSYS